VPLSFAEMYFPFSKMVLTSRRQDTTLGPTPNKPSLDGRTAWDLSRGCKPELQLRGCDAAYWGDQ
jgi:hypothetical protein